jgi:hypothetical protein
MCFQPLQATYKYAIMPHKNINDVLQKLFEKRSLLEVLMMVEKLFDDLNLYTYPGWIDGWVIEGPQLSRYWVDVALAFEYDNMPHPYGAKVLEKIGVQVVYRLDEILVAVDVIRPEDLQSNNRPKLRPKKVWLVYLTIPRRFIDEADLEDLQMFDEIMNIDIEEVSDAEDLGLNEDNDY